MSIEELLKKEKKLKKLKLSRNIIIPLMCLVAVFIIFVMISTFINGGNGKYILFYFISLVIVVLICPIIQAIYSSKNKSLYWELERSILNSIGIEKWLYTINKDKYVPVKSKISAQNYTDIKFFKEYEGALNTVCEIMEKKKKYEKQLKDFLKDNAFKSFTMYPSFEEKIKSNLRYTSDYYIYVNYTSPAGRSTFDRVISISRSRLQQLLTDKSLLMSKGEYNKYVREQEKSILDDKQHIYYEKVNAIIDYANNNKDIILTKNDVNELDNLIGSLFEKTVNSIKRIKQIDSEEWALIDNVIFDTEFNVKAIVEKSRRIINYYNSEAFLKIKKACETLMNTQREFNEYIDEKVKSISSLFGVRVVRNETNNADEYNYIHPYKKSINPFVAELSSNVFASAENNPLDYVVKYFYPNKDLYPEQIQKLHTLIEELETLKDAKQIIENYKKDINKYILEVPAYVMLNDEDGFYSRLGFAIIDENTLTIEYKFAYTSNGGKARRDFSIPMTEETIVELIKTLENKLTMSAFTKEQRSLMTSKLRHLIMERDHFTCKCCGNSTFKEPNLLLEIDHIIPVSKGGVTEESNLQTLCWKCNRQKGNKLNI